MNKSIGIAALCLALGGCFSSKEKTITTEYEETFSGIEEIEFVGKFFEVSYEGKENATEVRLDAYIEAPESSGIEVKYRTSGSKLIVEVVGDFEFGWNFGNNREGFISLTGPENIKLDFENGSGSIDVLNVVNDVIDLEVNSGGIKVNGIDAKVINLTASSGSINGSVLTGNIRAKVNSGSMDLSEIKGDIESEASSGSIKFEDVDGRVDAQVNSGNIKLLAVKELGRLEASSGSIKAEDSGLGSSSNFKANSGSITIHTPSDFSAFNFDLAANSGSVSLGDRQSEKRLEIDNGSSVRIEGRVSSGSLKISNQNSGSTE